MKITIEIEDRRKSKVDRRVRETERRKTISEIKGLFIEEKLKSMLWYFDKWGKRKQELLRFFMNNDVFNCEMIASHMECERTEVIECISKLTINSAIQKRGLYYIKYPMFTKLLKQLLAIKRSEV